VGGVKPLLFTGAMLVGMGVFEGIERASAAVKSCSALDAHRTKVNHGD
jgi:hypothetical protein